jgi:hypothetical protein
MATPRTQSSSGIFGRSNDIAPDPASEVVNATEGAVFTDRVFLIFCVVLGIVQVWISRYAMNSDGISYLDIGDAYFRGDWTEAVNAYWSPMYSLLLGLALHLLKPSIWWEFITVHIVNLVIYVVSLFSFRFLLRSLLPAFKEDEMAVEGASGPLPEWVLLGLEYGLFLWAALVLIDPGDVTPDLLVAAILFLIGGCLMDLRVHESYGKFAMFGALNGVAYLTKAIMFPLGIGFLAILLFSHRRSKRKLWGVFLASLVFALVCFPFVTAITLVKGRLTFGDSGKLTYASLVSPGSPQTHWQGEPMGSGVPSHTTRELLKQPRVFEFGDPVVGTYPPWYDPSYWNEGMNAQFRLRSQLRVLVQSGLTYARLLVSQLGLLAGVLIFVFMGGKATRSAIMANWPLLAGACLSIGTYSLVLVKTRYVGGSIVLLLLPVVAGIRVPKHKLLLSKYVAAAVMVTILFSVVVNIAGTAYASLTVGAHPSQREQIRAAEELARWGLKAGDKVAVVGDGMTDFWARLGRLKLVSEVASPEAGNREFWASSWEQRDSAYTCLSRTGARLVVAWNPPANNVDPGWKQISDTNYYAHFLPK